MWRQCVFLGVLWSFLAYSSALKVEILEPLQATGDEVALIFTTGNFIEGETFRKTAETIQAASGLRIWVALTGDRTSSLTGKYSVAKQLDGAITELTNAGMKSNIYVGVAHGRGGEVLYSEVGNFPLAAIILMGFCLPLDTNSQDYPLPVLTLAAELDGFTRITRAAEEYGKLKSDIKYSPETLYKAPVVYIKGMNHGQFGSAPLSYRITHNDLKADITEDEAHGMIGESVNAFLTATFSSSQAEVDQARKELDLAYSEAGEKFQPFLDVKSLDYNGNFSVWTVMAQRYIAEDLADRIQIKNKVGNALIYFFDAYIKTQNDLVEVGTYSFVRFSKKSEDYLMKVDPPLEINMRLKSKKAIWKALSDLDDASGSQTAFTKGPDGCISLNKYALEIALNKSTPEAQHRYRTEGRPIIFERDHISGSQFFWSRKSLKTWEDKTGLHVRAVSLTTPVAQITKPGLLYCKVVSPYLVMDWVNYQSLIKSPLVG